MTSGFWDTNLFIYRWELNPLYINPVRALRRKMLASGVELVTSTMTVGEIMTGPRKKMNETLAQQYKTTLSQVATIAPFDERAADLYARVRAEYGVKQPDAIQLACAASYGVEFFITNDEHLQKVRLPGIHFVVSIQTALQLLP